MLATFFRYLGNFLNEIGHQHPESVTNISNLSPTHLVSNIRHQHRCSRIELIRDSRTDNCKGLADRNRTATIIQDHFQL